MAQTEREPEPIRQSVHVDCPIEDAFELFTGRFGEWWPQTSHSMGGEEAEGGAIEPFPGGRVFERTRSGDERERGRVLAWDPPRRVEFTWHEGTVEVEFSVEADGTRVTLTHSGWHLAARTACVMRAGLLAGFACFAAQHAMAAA